MQASDNQAAVEAKINEHIRAAHAPFNFTGLRFVCLGEYNDRNEQAVQTQADDFKHAIITNELGLLREFYKTDDDELVYSYAYENLVFMSSCDRDADQAERDAGSQRSPRRLLGF